MNIYFLFITGYLAITRIGQSKHATNLCKETVICGWGQSGTWVTYEIHTDLGRLHEKMSNWEMAYLLSRSLLMKDTRLISFCLSFSGTPGRKIEKKVQSVTTKDLVENEKEGY